MQGLSVLYLTQKLIIYIVSIPLVDDNIGPLESNWGAHKLFQDTLRCIKKKLIKIQIKRKINLFIEMHINGF